MPSSNSSSLPEASILQSAPLNTSFPPSEPPEPASSQGATPNLASILQKSPNKLLYLYTSSSPEYRGCWQNWWRTTRWYQLNEARPRQQQTHITWLDPEKNNYSIWQHFIHAAQISDGTPQVHCTRCYKTLPHPTYCREQDGNIVGQRYGTSHMTTHLRSNKCQGSVARRGIGQLTFETLTHPGRAVSSSN